MLLDVQNLTVDVKERYGYRSIIRNVSFKLKKNTCLGILGESGSGKSMTTKAIMGLLEEPFKVGGKAYFKGQDLISMSADEKADLRGKALCMILQNPMTAFNPLYTIGNQMLETLILHLSLSKKEAKQLAIEALESVHLHDGEGILKKYPHELSGGMLQRIMIALTIAVKPEMVIADEPTTAIDCINQIQIIKEFKRLRIEQKTAMIFITHDLSVLAELADEVIVMHQGTVVECGNVREVITQPKNDYTKYLIDTRLELLGHFEKILN